MEKSFLMITLLAVLLSSCGGVTPAADLSAVPNALITHPDWDVITSENIGNLEEITTWGESVVYDVAVSPDKETIAVRTIDGIHFYDSRTLDEERFLEYKINKTIDSSVSISYSPDGRYVAMSVDSFVDLFNLTTNKYDKHFISAIPDASVSNIEISPDNRYAVVTTSKGSSYCDGAGGNLALYDISGKYGRLVFDRYYCVPSYSRYRFTANNRAYFFLWYATSYFPSQMDVIDLTTGGLIESVLYDLENPDPEKTFYDISPDGDFFASVDMQKEDVFTKVIDTATGDVLQTVEGYITFTLSSDGSVHWKNMFSGRSDRISHNCKIGLNDTDVYEEVVSHDNFVTIIYPDLHSLQSIEIWDKDRCEIVRQVSFFPYTLSSSSEKGKFSPDGHLYAKKNGYKLDVWNVKTGQLQFVAKSPSFRFPVNVFIFNHNGTRLVTSTYERHNNINSPYQKYSFSVWDTLTGQLLRTVETGGEYLRDIVAGPKNHLIAAQDSDSISFWNIETGEKVATVPPGNFAFDTTGSTVWVISPESKAPLSLYNVDTGRQLGTIPVSEQNVRGFYLNKENSRAALLAYNSEDKIDNLMILDLQSGQEIYKIPLDLWSANWAAAGEYFATYNRNGYIDLWDFQDDVPFQKLYGYRTLDTMRNQKDFAYISNDFIHQVIFSPNNKIVFSVDYRNNVRIWDISSGKLLGEIRPTFKIIGIAISPDGRLVAAEGADGFVHLWGVKHVDK